MRGQCLSSLRASATLKVTWIGENKKGRLFYSLALLLSWNESGLDTLGWCPRSSVPRFSIVQMVWTTLPETCIFATNLSSDFKWLLLFADSWRRVRLIDSQGHGQVFQGHCVLGSLVLLWRVQSHQFGGEKKRFWPQVVCLRFSQRWYRLAWPKSTRCFPWCRSRQGCSVWARYFASFKTFPNLVLDSAFLLFATGVCLLLCLFVLFFCLFVRLFVNAKDCFGLHRCRRSNLRSEIRRTSSISRTRRSRTLLRGQ